MFFNCDVVKLQLFFQYAIKRRFANTKKEGKKEHWLDWAEDKYGVGIVKL